MRLNERALAVAGLFSNDKFKRLRSLELLHSFFLHRLPDEERHEHCQRAPRLKAEQLSEARLYTDREAMLHALPKGGVVAEVGTWRGGFSACIASICQPAALHLLDLDFSPLNEAAILSKFAGMLHKHEGDSSTILKSFPEHHFDWLYIDAAHDYEGVSFDLAAAHRVLRPGGLIMCNDYTNADVESAQTYGVARAVNEFCLASGYSVLGLALHPLGYHDILIRKSAGTPSREPHSP